MQLGEDAMASDVRDAEAWLDESTAIVAPGYPGAHRDADGAATEQREEPERGRSLVVVGDPGYQVDPSIFGSGQSFHTRDNLYAVVDAEFQLLDIPQCSSHEKSIAAGSASECPVSSTVPSELVQVWDVPTALILDHCL